MEKILCSACLLGVACRFDGRSKPNEKVIALSNTHQLIPICPEQLGGLPTPRIPSEILNSHAINQLSEDVTHPFIKGAEEVLKIARLFNVKKAILKSRSPSCGKGEIYNGTFTKTLVAGDGITTKLLRANEIEVITEEEIEKFSTRTQI